MLSETIQSKSHMAWDEKLEQDGAARSSFLLCLLYCFISSLSLSLCHTACLLQHYWILLRQKTWKWWGGKEEEEEEEETEVVARRLEWHLRYPAGWRAQPQEREDTCSVSRTWTQTSQLRLSKFHQFASSNYFVGSSQLFTERDWFTPTPPNTHALFDFADLHKGMNLIYDKWSNITIINVK